MTQAVQAAGSSRGLYYIESGAVPPAAPIAGLLVGGVTAIVGGIVYGYADHYVGFIYIEALMTLAFGALIGWATGRAMVAAKVRSAGSVTIFTLLTTIVGYYVAWVAWICALSNDAETRISMIRLAVRPLVVWRLILGLNEVGVWGFSHDSPVSGIPLWIVWFLEAAMIFFTSLAIARAIAKKRPFCENCGKWTIGPKTLVTTANMDTADLKQRLESHQLNFVSQLPTYSGTDWQYLDWNAYGCEACKNFNTLSVIRTQVKRDKRGKTSRTKKTIIGNLLVTVSELDQVRSRPVAAAAAPRGPMPGGPVPTGPVAAGSVPAATIPAPPPVRPPTVSAPPLIPSPAIAPSAAPLVAPNPKPESTPPPHDGKLLDL
jgi:hypothetical protein